MSQRALGQQFGPLFHGTSHNIEGAVLPRDAAGVKHRGGWEQDGANTRAHASSNEDTAWDFAATSSRRRQRQAQDATWSRVVPERSRVYEVEPASDTRIGVEHEEHPDFRKAGSIDSAEHISNIGFKIKRQIDVKPPQHGETWRQGTFPQVNWAEHGLDLPMDRDLYNHPSQSETEHGSRKAAEEHANSLPAKGRPTPEPEDPNQGALFSDRRFRRRAPKASPPLSSEMY